MLNTILCKRTALPLGLLSLALVLPSCGSSEYKKYADNQAKQVASILRENGCMQCHS
ncbi:MAG TPA: cytochrome B6, partial [Parabacteroides merdae]|nr:cytochrome B6 [Parabacteroides merdae]